MFYLSKEYIVGCFKTSGVTDYHFEHANALFDPLTVSLAKLKHLLWKVDFGGEFSHESLELL